MKGMTLEKAIEHQELICTNLKGSLGYEGVEAIKLGIEALKRCKYLAEHTDRWSGVLLPGEAQDDKAE